MAKTALGRVGLVNKGTYSASETYTKNDFVSDGNNSLYISLLDNNKGNALSESAWWFKFFDGTAANTATTAANNAAESAQHVVDTYDDVINTLAHSGCTLDERVEAIERALISVLSGAVVIPKLQVNELGVWGDNNLAPVGDGAPTKAPDRAGQFYIDKTARALYFSTGNTAVSDWKIQ